MPISNEDCAATYKVVVVGDSGVGKSAILSCLVGRPFDERTRPTVGSDFVTKILEADGALVELRIWDTPGMDKFRSMTRRQFCGVQGIVLVYDVTSRKSFENVKYWIQALPSISPSPGSHKVCYEPIPFVMVANKTDVDSHDKVSLLEGMKMAHKNMAFGFYETSAKTGRNVFTPFHDLAFTITDINNPTLMKSYHPHLIRPLKTSNQVKQESQSKNDTSGTAKLRNKSKTKTPTTSKSKRAFSLTSASPPSESSATASRPRRLSSLLRHFLRPNSDRSVGARRRSLPDGANVVRPHTWGSEMFPPSSDRESISGIYGHPPATKTTNTATTTTTTNNTPRRARLKKTEITRNRKKTQGKNRSSLFCACFHSKRKANLKRQR